MDMRGDRYIKNNRKPLLIGIGGIVILGAIVSIVSAFLPARLQSDESLAREQVALCRGSIGEEKKEICYQKTVPTLMDRGLSMERTFAVLTQLLKLDHTYQSCHVLSHLITSKEVAKDPSKWKDVIVRSPLTICGQGAVHGAFQERFRAESFPEATAQTLGAMLDGVCDPRAGWSPTLLDRSSCMHGMGHLFLYVTKANVTKSVALCDALGKRPDFDFRQTCTEGVFMQLYQPLEPEDKTLIHAIESAAHDTKTFCAQFNGMVRNACVKESWPAVPNSASNPKVFEALCTQLTNREAIHYCASGLMYPVIEVLHYDVPAIEKFCNGLAESDIRDICWARTASKFIWADRSNTAGALSICNAAPDASKAVCWNELINMAQTGMRQDSADVQGLCGGMPEPFKKTCTDHTTTHR